MPDSTPNNANVFSLSFTYGTHNPALLILRDKGYEISIIPDSADGPSTFIATASGRRFASNGGVAELLGLVTIWEHFGENWNQQEPNIMEELYQNPPSE